MLTTTNRRYAAIGIMVLSCNPCGSDQPAPRQDLAMTLMGNDHLDLLLSAALDWDVPLPPSPRAALSRLHPPAVLAGEAGTRLRQHNLASLTATGTLGAAGPYQFTPVADCDPVVVAKAAHAMSVACRADPRWAGSASQGLVDAIEDAALVRIETPWEWRRPSPRFGPAVGIGLAWRPDVPGLEWIEPSDAGRFWRTAAHLVVAADAVDELPLGLEPREVILLIGAASPSARAWQVLGEVAQDPVVAWWPVARPWLSALLGPELVTEDG